MATENPLNEAQQRRLLGNSQYADKLLSDIEAILSAAESKTIFPKFVSDLSPAQVQLIRGYMARFRTQLARALDGLAIRPPAPSFGALHSVRVTLTFVRVAVQEMAPHYLRGYGEVAEQAVSQLEGVCAELEGMLERLSAALAESPESSLPARLARLQQAGGSVEMLRLLGRIIADRGLVELRPRLSMILERLESNRFEIAVFGRVSSGKSSLLNHILRTEALPVGVNPITAVPTRLVHGPQALLTASFAGGSVERLPIERLPEFVSEIHNPANCKGVARLVVELPCDRLRTGIALVDTPGLGAFAAAGAAETLAYLPQCDLGVVLIAAGSPLNDEDLSTILRLYEAAIPVKVLLSKADLLSSADLASALDYTARQLQRVLGADIGLHAVSTAQSHADLLEQWFSGEIAPLYEKHQQLAQESSRRKTARLRDAVAAALQAKLSGAGAVRRLTRTSCAPWNAACATRPADSNRRASSACVPPTKFAPWRRKPCTPRLRHWPKSGSPPPGTAPQPAPPSPRRLPKRQPRPLRCMRISSNSRARWRRLYNAWPLLWVVMTRPRSRNS